MTLNTIHTEDRELVQKVLNGDNSAFSVIIKNTAGLVSHIVFKMISSTEDRRDLAQDIYLKVYKNLAAFKFHSKLSTWVAQIAFNTCLNYLEKKKLIFLEDPISDEKGPEEALMLLANKSLNATNDETTSGLLLKERAAILQTEIDSLPEIYKTLIVLYHYEEFSYEEIAQITSLPDGTVKNYLFRARKALRDRVLLKYNKEELL